MILSTGFASAQTADTITNLEEITVTGTKRDQPLAKVDGGVSVVSGDTLREKDVRTVADLQKVFPGLKIDSRGNSAYANVTVRGVSSPDFYSPAVQIYVDGAPQAPSAFIQDLVDVERVEFLRGPQGTLYGRNAFAGVINIVTKKPREARADVSATAANNLFEGGVAATAPLNPDSVFVDLAVKAKRFRGDIDQIGGKNRVNDGETFNGRAQFRYAPEGGPFDALAWISHERLDSSEEIYVLDSDVKRRKYDFASIGVPPGKLKRDVTSTGATFNYRFEDVTVSNTAAFEWVDLDRSTFGFDFPEKDRNFSNELKAVYDAGGPLKGVAGVAYLDGKFTRDAPGFAGFYSASRNEVKTESLAVFGEATYSLTDRLDLTAGARLSKDWAKIDFDRTSASPDYVGFTNKDDFTGFQPKVSLGYQIDETSRVYALVSRGYKPGGFNRAIQTTADSNPYDPEKAWNYELGGRTSLFDNKLFLSGALYHIRSTDKQIYVGPVGVQVLRNAGKAESTGVELEATIRPVESLTLTAAAAFGRSRFTGGQYDGRRVPYAPDAKTDISFRYTLPQSGIPYAVTLTGAAHLVSKVYFDEDNSLSQKGFATFDAGIEVALPKNVTLKVFADNLTDKAYRTYSFMSGVNRLSSIGQGRLVGVSMRTSF